MPNQTIHRLKILSPSDPTFATVATMVNPPATDADKVTFLPAYAGFNIADGTEVDISYFYAPPSDPSEFKPRQRFDRHLRTDELWVVAEGDFLLPLSACRRPEDPEDPPRPEDFHCFAFRQGDMFVIKPNVWHCGPWPTRPNTPVRFFMMLAGHRKRQDGENSDYVDFYQREFLPDVGILPDVSGVG